MKWVGVALLVASSYFCGICLATRENQRLYALNSLYLLMEYMKRRIAFRRTPLFDLFADFSDEYLESSGFLKIIRSSRNNIDKLWYKGIKSLPLPNEVLSEMLIFGNDLGKLNAETQIEKIEVCLRVLDNARGQLKQTLPAKKKSIKTVALLGGLLAAIILL